MRSWEIVPLAVIAAACASLSLTRSDGTTSITTREGYYAEFSVTFAQDGHAVSKISRRVNDGSDRGT